MLAPLPFEPRLVEKVWGGDRLARMLGLEAGGGPVGEAWCLSPLGSRPTPVRDGAWRGRSLDEVLQEWNRLHPAIPASFPILIKFLESSRPLSLQVHPDDDRARAHRDGACGKAEAWLVIDCEPGTRVVHGLQEGIGPGDLEAALASDPAKVLDLCRHIEVRPGDVVPIPPGVIHTIRGSMVWVEVQQAADVTYRLYDWGRTGPDRLLHPEKALASTRFDGLPAAPLEARPLAPGRRLLWGSPWFVMESVTLADGDSLPASEVLEAWTCLSGRSRVSHEGAEIPLDPGQVLVVSSLMAPCVRLGGEPASFLRVYRPDSVAALRERLEGAGFAVAANLYEA